MKKLMLAVGLFAVAGSAFAAKPCEELKAEIDAKIKANGVPAYTLEIVDKGSVTDKKVVGTCDGGTRKSSTSAADAAPATSISGAGFPMGAGPFFAAMSTLPTMGLVAARRESVPSNGLIPKSVLGFRHAQMALCLTSGLSDSWKTDFGIFLLTRCSRWANIAPFCISGMKSWLSIAWPLSSCACRSWPAPPPPRRPRPDPRPPAAPAGRTAQAPGGTPATARQGSARRCGCLRRRRALLRDPPHRAGRRRAPRRKRASPTAGALPGALPGRRPAQCAAQGRHRPLPGSRLRHHPCLPATAGPGLRDPAHHRRRRPPGGPGQLRAGQPARTGDELSGQDRRAARPARTGATGRPVESPAVAPGATGAGARQRGRRQPSASQGRARQALAGLRHAQQRRRRQYRRAADGPGPGLGQPAGPGRPAQPARQPRRGDRPLAPFRQPEPVLQPALGLVDLHLRLQPERLPHAQRASGFPSSSMATAAATSSAPNACCTATV